MATLGLWVATAWHFDLVMAGIGLRLLGMVCLKLAESARDYAQPRQGGGLWPKVVGSWGWFWAQRAIGLGTESKRRLKKAQEIAEKVGLFDE